MISLPERSDKRDVWALAAAASDLSLDWVDGVRGEEIPFKAIPAVSRLSSISQFSRSPRTIGLGYERIEQDARLLPRSS